MKKVSHKTGQKCVCNLTALISWYVVWKEFNSFVFHWVIGSIRKQRSQMHSRRLLMRKISPFVTFKVSHKWSYSRSYWHLTFVNLDTGENFFFFKKKAKCKKRYNLLFQNATISESSNDFMTYKVQSCASLFFPSLSLSFNLGNCLCLSKSAVNLSHFIWFKKHWIKVYMVIW